MLKYETNLKIYRKDFTQLANVIVWYDHKILFIQRRTNPFAGYWSIPGGHVENTETHLDTAIRELHEEVGIIAKNLSHIVTFIDDSLHLECHVYELEVKDMNADNLEPTEHKDVAWLTPKDALEKDLTPGLAEVLQKVQ